MKIAHIAAAVAVIVLTTVSALVAGRLTNRWGVSPTAEQAGTRLLEMPKNVGPWKLKQEMELNETARDLLQCENYLHRMYEHSDTHDQVAIAVLMGPPGPIAVHTPDVCYSAREYEIKEPRKHIKFDTGKSQTLWTMRFQSRTVDAQLLQVAYGWSDGTQWKAPEDARWQYLGNSHLYKLQIAAISGDVNREPDVVCNEFLEEFLPLMSQYLVPATRN